MKNSVKQSKLAKRASLRAESNEDVRSIRASMLKIQQEPQHIFVSTASGIVKRSLHKSQWCKKK
jgi:hypothetical protein